MPSTTPLGLPTPLDADPLANIAPAIRNGLTAIDQVTIDKTADTIKNNTAVLANDPHLVRAVVNGKKYKFKIVLFAIAASSAIDIKLAFAHPGGSLNWGIAQGMDPAVASSTVGAGQFGASLLPASGAGPLSVGVASAATMVIIEGRYTPNASGNLQLQWAQNAATVGDLTVKAMSYMEVQIVP